MAIAQTRYGLLLQQIGMEVNYVGSVVMCYYK